MVIRVIHGPAVAKGVEIGDCRGGGSTVEKDRCGVMMMMAMNLVVMHRRKKIKKNIKKFEQRGKKGNQGASRLGQSLTQKKKNKIQILLFTQGSFFLQDLF